MIAGHLRVACLLPGSATIQAMAPRASFTPLDLYLFGLAVVMVLATAWAVYGIGWLVKTWFIGWVGATPAPPRPSLLRRCWFWLTRPLRRRRRQPADMVTH